MRQVVLLEALVAAPRPQDGRDSRYREARGRLLGSAGALQTGNRRRAEGGTNGEALLTVALSLVFIIFSTMGAGPVIHPSRAPGATIFEKESTRMTRPSMSSERKVGTMGLSAPFGRICKKQSFVSLSY